MPSGALRRPPSDRRDTATRAGEHASGVRAAALQARMYDHALAIGFSRGYPVSVCVMVVAVFIALTVIRIRRLDLSGADPALAARGS